MLNNLYISSNKAEQTSARGKRGKQPQVVFTENIEEYLSDNSEDYKEFYKLRTVNKKRFENINNSGKSAIEIYEKYQELYPNYGRISVMDVLTNSNYDENPDELMSFLNLLFQVLNEYNNKNYGEVIRILKSVRKSLPYGKLISVFDGNLLKIEFHKDKVRLKEKMDSFVTLLESTQSLGVKIQELTDKKIISGDFYNFIFL